MNSENLKAKVLEAIEDYIASEETFGDTALLSVNPESLSISVVDGEEVSEAEMQESNIDYYDIIDLVQMNPENGQWTPDMESIDNLVQEYTA